ncbi:MAG TPA: lytic transglycosylase domain-containing protein [Longimicrobiales bacterium]|nr:lytic transglycosylase domain-containing protein [Longimicrobiales bacterium]
MTDTTWKDRRRRLLDTLLHTRKARRRASAEAGASRPDRRGTGRVRYRRGSRLRGPLIGAMVAGIGLPLAASRPAEAGAAKLDTAASSSIRRATRARREMIQRAVERYGIDPELATEIHDVAASEGVSPSLAYGLVSAESSFRERVVSYAGALGLTQVLPSTARWVLDTPEEREALFDRRTNLQAGFRYLRYLQERYDGDVKLALLAYNRGPGTVETVLEQGVDPDNGYPDRVLEHAI